MKTDKSPDKYKEIFQELKEEKMNWDFEDFLKETEKEKPFYVISKKKNTSSQKIYWLAASFVLLVSMGFFFKFLNNNSIDEQDNLVKNEILKQKEKFNQDVNLAVNEISDSLKMKRDSTTTLEQITETDITDQILPKRSRMKKQVRQHYAQTTNQKKSVKKQSAKTSEYESNYVIINGQKITSEKEAIDLTKYSFRIFSENVSKTIAQTEALNTFNNDY